MAMKQGTPNETLSRWWQFLVAI